MRFDLAGDNKSRASSFEDVVGVLCLLQVFAAISLVHLVSGAHDALRTRGLQRETDIFIWLGKVIPRYSKAKKINN